MKTLSNYFLPGFAVIALFFSMCKNAQDKKEKTGKAGDHLDLFAVLHTFEQSSSPEAFEQSLNSKSTGINNLDLNEDGQTDYIKVSDKKIDDESHVLILQVDVASGETQDVAAIEIRKTGEREAHLQIVGDEDLYGADYIVEPQSHNATAGFAVATTVAVNVWTWPAVAFIYSPAYVVWTSPYRYEYYPVWWEPWPVVVYDVYYPVVSVYRVNYAFSDGYRFVHVHENYHNHYHASAKFHYTEKNHGVMHTNVKNNHQGNDTKGKDNGHRSSDPGFAVGNDQHDNGAAGNRSPSVNDKNKSPGGNDQQKAGGKESRVHQKGNGGMNQSSSPQSQPKQNNNSRSSGSPKGGKTGGGNGGGKHK
jgi:hypothetical protein